MCGANNASQIPPNQTPQRFQLNGSDFFIFFLNNQINYTKMLIKITQIIVSAHQIYLLVFGYKIFKKITNSSSNRPSTCKRIKRLKKSCKYKNQNFQNNLQIFSMYFRIMLETFFLIFWRFHRLINGYLQRLCFSLKTWKRNDLNCRNEKRYNR